MQLVRGCDTQRTAHGRKFKIPLPSRIWFHNNGALGFANVDTARTHGRTFHHHNNLQSFVGQMILNTNVFTWTVSSGSCRLYVCSFKRVRCILNTVTSTVEITATNDRVRIRFVGRVNWPSINSKCPPECTSCTDRPPRMIAIIWSLAT